MKRCWFGFALLVVLLAGSLGVSWCMDRIHTPIAADLRLAAERAVGDDWEGAVRCSRRAERQWGHWSHLRDCFADHTPTEAVSAELSAMARSRQAGEKGAFAASCARAAQMVQAVGDAHGLHWWSIL